MSVAVELTNQNGDVFVFTIEPADGYSVLDLVEAAKLTTPFGCRVGTCGTCVVRVLAGAELLDAPRQMESDTLTRIPGENPQDLRLACRAGLVLKTGEPRVEITLKLAEA